MANTKRESILDAIKTALQGIDGTGSYTNTLVAAQVTSAYRDLSKVPAANMPFLCLAPGPANYVPLTALEYTSGESENQLDGWLISVIGYLKKNTDEQNKEDMENLIADIIIAIETDPHLGLASYVHGSTLRSIIPFLDIDDNIIVLQVSFLIKYDFNRITP